MNRTKNKYLKWEIRTSITDEQKKEINYIKYIWGWNDAEFLREAIRRMIIDDKR